MTLCHIIVASYDWLVEEVEEVEEEEEEVGGCSALLGLSDDEDEWNTE